MGPSRQGRERQACCRGVGAERSADCLRLISPGMVKGSSACHAATGAMRHADNGFFLGRALTARNSRVRRESRCLRQVRLRLPRYHASIPVRAPISANVCHLELVVSPSAAPPRPVLPVCAAGYPSALELRMRARRLVVDLPDRTRRPPRIGEDHGDQSKQLMWSGVATHCRTAATAKARWGGGLESIRPRPRPRQACAPIWRLVSTLLPQHAAERSQPAGSPPKPPADDQRRTPVCPTRLTPWRG